MLRLSPSGYELSYRRRSYNPESSLDKCADRSQTAAPTSNWPPFSRQLVRYERHGSMPCKYLYRFIAAVRDYAVFVVAQKRWTQFFPKAPKPIWPQQDIFWIHGVLTQSTMVIFPDLFH